MSKNQHDFSGRRVVGFAYCKKCGLVWLSNEATRKAVKAACPSEEE